MERNMLVYPYLFISPTVLVLLFLYWFLFQIAKLSYFSVYLVHKQLYPVRRPRFLSFLQLAKLVCFCLVCFCFLSSLVFIYKKKTRVWYQSLSFLGQCMNWSGRTNFINLTSYPRLTSTLDHKSHSCYLHSRTQPHSLHSDSGHLNTLIDLLLSLGTQQEETLKKVTEIQIDLSKQKQSIKDLSQNIEYLKQSIELLTRKLNQATIDYSLPQTILTSVLSQNQKLQGLKQLLEDIKYK